MAKGDAIGYPVCKICGEAHPFRDGHSWDRLPNKKQIDGVAKPAARDIEVIPPRRTGTAREAPGSSAPVTIDGIAGLKQVDSVHAPTTTKVGRPATGFDRKAYQRDKAKARRAAKKAGT